MAFAPRNYTCHVHEGALPGPFSEVPQDPEIHCVLIKDPERANSAVETQHNSEKVNRVTHHDKRVSGAIEFRIKIGMPFQTKLHPIFGREPSSTTTRHWSPLVLSETAKAWRR